MDILFATSTRCPSAPTTAIQLTIVPQDHGFAGLVRAMRASCTRAQRAWQEYSTELQTAR